MINIKNSKYRIMSEEVDLYTPVMKILHDIGGKTCEICNIELSSLIVTKILNITSCNFCKKKICPDCKKICSVCEATWCSKHSCQHLAYPKEKFSYGLKILNLSPGQIKILRELKPKQICHEHAATAHMLYEIKHSMNSFFDFPMISPITSKIKVKHIKAIWKFDESEKIRITKEEKYYNSLIEESKEADEKARIAKEVAIKAEKHAKKLHETLISKGRCFTSIKTSLDFDNNFPRTSNYMQNLGETCDPKFSHSNEDFEPYRSYLAKISSMIIASIVKYRKEVLQYSDELCQSTLASKGYCCCISGSRKEFELKDFEYMMKNYCNPDNEYYSILTSDEFIKLFGTKTIMSRSVGWEKHYNHPGLLGPIRASINCCWNNMGQFAQEISSIVSNKLDCYTMDMKQISQISDKLLNISQSTPKIFRTINCYICHDGVRFDNSFQLKPCNHAFHPSCLRKWRNTCLINRRDFTCPNCRAIPTNTDLW